MKNKDKLYDELIEMFMWYQWRLENPIPTPNDTEERVIRHYMMDLMFNRKVKSLACGVMLKIDEHESRQRTGERQ